MCAVFPPGGAALQVPFSTPSKNISKTARCRAQEQLFYTSLSTMMGDSSGAAVEPTSPRLAKCIRAASTELKPEFGPPTPLRSLLSVSTYRVLAYLLLSCVHIYHGCCV